jgi:uncharacterized membrane protein
LEAQDRTEALEQRDISRVEAFSDGVFAFAITLLVLSIHIPRPGDADTSAGLQHVLLQQWPSYVTFALTFALVGIIWANHRLTFSHLIRSDHVLVSLNLLELMGVAFLPVPTAVLGAWIASDHNRLAAVLFYGGTLLLLGIFHNVLWWYAAYWGGLTSPEFPAEKRRALTLAWLAGPALYGVCMLLALVDPRLSIAGFALLATAYLLPTPRVIMLAQRRRRERQTRVETPTPATRRENGHRGDGHKSAT